MAMIPLREGDAIEPTPDMYEEAAVWILRLRESSDEAELELFRAWQAEAPARQFAVAEMETLFDGVKPSATNALAQVERRCIKRDRWRITGIAAALALVLLGVGKRDTIAIYLRADDTTIAGEQRRIVLPDGTRIALNSGSAIDRQFTARTRGVTLMRGEAFFDVARDKARPFVVQAGGARVTVVGTHFNVRLDGDETIVTVEEGVVRLASGAGRGKELRLTAGQQGFVEGRAVQAQPNFDALAASAWRRGQIVFYNARLDAVTEELNRYRRGPILLLNRAFAAERISGVFRISQPEDVLRSLEKQLGARSIALPGGAVILY